MTGWHHSGDLWGGEAVKAPTSPSRPQSQPQSRLCRYPVSRKLVSGTRGGKTLLHEEARRIRLVHRASFQSEVNGIAENGAGAKKAGVE